MKQNIINIYKNYTEINHQRSISNTIQYLKLQLCWSLWFVSCYTMLVLSLNPLSAYSHVITPTNQSIFMYFIIIVFYTIHCFLTLLFNTISLSIIKTDTYTHIATVRCFCCCCRYFRDLSLKGSSPHTLLFYLYGSFQRI